MDFSLAIESGFVAVYCAGVFIMFHLFIQNPYALLFVFGFSKHLLGAYLGMQDYYCNHGNACRDNDKGKYYTYSRENLVLESALEGAWFLVFGSLAFYFAKTFSSRVAAIFILGFATHLVSEMVGLHHYICENRCVG
jgi:hypothetical protein